MKQDSLEWVYTLKVNAADVLCWTSPVALQHARWSSHLANRSDLPPTHTIKPMEAPPGSDRPTSAMLKGDIDTGRTGDKNPVFDPGLAPLGTDDEAAGTPPSMFRVALARHSENLERWIRGSSRVGAAHNNWDGFPGTFVGFIGLVALVLMIGIWAVRAG